MASAAPVTAPAIRDRSDFAFSAQGRYGVCVSTDYVGRTLESWTLTSEVAQYQAMTHVTLDPATRALPLDDGRILLLNPARESESHHWELTLLRPTNGGCDLHQLGTIPARWGAFFLPSPIPDLLGCVVTADGLEQSTIWRLPASLDPAELVMPVPGLLAGGRWLDGEALLLGINQTVLGAPSSGIAVDLRQGSWKRIWSVSDASSDQILLHCQHSKLLIVSTNGSGQHRLGWARTGDPTVHFPEVLHRPGYERQALTLDDQGERLLIHEATGAISRLLVYTPAQDRLEVLGTPPGKISGPASWVGDLVRIRWSAPGHPPTLATVGVGAQTRWSVAPDPPFANRPAQPPAELVTLRGPAGPIEAIVYGGADWRQQEHLVVALHGGPLAAWQFEFQPLFHTLSAAGMAVVAPNYRGSTGYGKEHVRAVIGNWGGPDLDDVVALAAGLNEDRASQQLPRPIVLGVSYGAFLALLAACRAPQSWSACVALAPFLSAERFHENALCTVQCRIEQLGGLQPVADAVGPRDVLGALPTLSAPLLIMHGVEDLTVPVEQSRTLRRRLLELGWTEDIDFDYVELDCDHFELILAQRAELNQRVRDLCLKHSRLDRHRPIEPLPTVMGSGASQPSTARR